MAHNLNETNGKTSMMYYGETPWHKLGQQLDKPATAAEAIEAAGLDFEVKKVPVFTKVGKTQTEIEGHYATMRMDTNQVLGMVGEKYQVIQNTNAFSVFDPLVERDEAIYHTAGALGKGERIWIMAKLPDHIKLGKSDIVDKYVLVTNSHNGWSSLKVKITPVRVVCENTLSFALQGKSAEVSVRHTATAQGRMEEAHKILGLVNVVYNVLAEIFERMTLKKITNKQLMDYVKALVPDRAEAETNKRREETREQILELVEVGAGHELNTARGTVWGAYQAATELIDHVKTSRTGDDGRLQSMWFGTGERFKVNAFELAKGLLRN